MSFEEQLLELHTAINLAFKSINNLGAELGIPFDYNYEILHCHSDREHRIEPLSESTLNGDIHFALVDGEVCGYISGFVLVPISGRTFYFVGGMSLTNDRQGIDRRSINTLFNSLMTSIWQGLNIGSKLDPNEITLLDTVINLFNFLYIFSFMPPYMNISATIDKDEPKLVDEIIGYFTKLALYEVNKWEDHIDLSSDEKIILHKDIERLGDMTEEKIINKLSEVYSLRMINRFIIFKCIGLNGYTKLLNTFSSDLEDNNGDYNGIFSYHMGCGRKLAVDITKTKDAPFSMDCTTNDLPNFSCETLLTIKMGL